ncbi:MAG: cytochrome c biogenesis heme-transporting ATPase CcmA [Sulfuriflexus sp.]|nr:cytochrome c biogenesis heme-transporting ATPase CcmA [Sulfuriflexus sp.]
MLQANALAAERGGQRLFSDVSFSLKDGDLLHLSGSNGSGKTTLLRMLCGLTLPVNGDISWQQKNIESNRDAFNADLLYIGHRHGMHSDLNALENLQLSTQQLSNSTMVFSALEEVGLSHHLNKPLRLLSQGQQRRVALARLLLESRKLWILDEPLAALDVDAVEWFSQRLAKHLENGGMAIVTTHQEASFISHVSINVVLGS